MQHLDHQCGYSMTKEIHKAINIYNQGEATWYSNNSHKAEVEPFVQHISKIQIKSIPQDL